MSIAQVSSKLVMIVDDTPANLKLLEGMLIERGYSVRAFPSGQLAVQAAQREPPDLILLDVMMPGIDGFTTCRQLKADPLTREIPVIFLSSLSETTDKLKAFTAGGVDYITKPFQTEEVAARVSTHLALLGARRELDQRNRQLEASLSRQAELEKMRDDLVHMMVHDMRSPLMGIQGNLSFLSEDLQGNPEPEVRQAVDAATGAATRLVDMVSAMLDVSRLESQQMPVSLREADLAVVVKQAIDGLGALTRKCALEVRSPASGLAASCDPDLTARVVANLLGNALKFTPSGGAITVELAESGACARVSVIDTGPGIPPEWHRRIFEKFGQVSGEDRKVKHSTGLGLAFCKLAVEAQSGTIGLTSTDSRGSTFWFELPRP
ncbi:MAG: hybrid sensor histidine kinase/response regulator [Candidatus Wallbacteria bacterium]|nr:hybrid sensor histidine kinase/response regulator [Candidatus Wallbacteria bacterium]